MLNPTLTKFFNLIYPAFMVFSAQAALDRYQHGNLWWAAIDISAFVYWSYKTLQLVNQK